MSDNKLHEKKYSAKEAAGKLGISVRQVQQLAADMVISAYRVGNKLVFAESDLNAYWEDCKLSPTVEPVRRRRRRTVLPANIGAVKHLKLDMKKAEG